MRWLLVFREGNLQNLLIMTTWSIDGSLSWKINAETALADCLGKEIMFHKVLQTLQQLWNSIYLVLVVSSHLSETFECQLENIFPKASQLKNWTIWVIALLSETGQIKKLMRMVHIFGSQPNEKSGNKHHGFTASLYLLKLNLRFKKSWIPCWWWIPYFLSNQQLSKTRCSSFWCQRQNPKTHRRMKISTFEYFTLQHIVLSEKKEMEMSNCPQQTVSETLAESGAADLCPTANPKKWIGHHFVW